MLIISLYVSVVICIVILQTYPPQPTSPNHNYVSFFDYFHWHPNPIMIFAIIGSGRNNDQDRSVSELQRFKGAGYTRLFYLTFMKYIWRITRNRIALVVITVLYFIQGFANTKLSLQKGALTDAIVKKRDNSGFELAKVTMLQVTTLIIGEVSKMISCSAINKAFTSACTRQCRKIITQIPNLFDTFPTANVMWNIQIYGESIKMVCSTMMDVIIPLIATITTYSYTTFRVINLVAAFALILVCVIYIFLVYQMHRVRLNQRISNSIKLDKCQELLKNTLDNQELIYMNNTFEYETRKFSNYLGYTYDQESEYVKNNHRMAVVLGMFFYFCEMQILFYECFIRKNLTVKQFTFFSLTLGKLHTQLKSVTRVCRIISTNLIMIRLKMDIRDNKSKPISVKTENKSIARTKIENKAEFKHEWSIRNLNYLNLFTGASLTIRKGEKIAITGKNGSGKTTLLRCMLRHIQTEAESKFDENVIDSFDEIKDAFGYIQQSSTLFSQSVHYNLKYGNKHQEINKIYNAARDLSVHETIKSLSNGYETICGENGNMISRGTKQKIALLREWIKNKPILLLDEATASIETKDEEMIWKTILSKEDLTVVAVMPESEKMRLFDKVYKVEDKRIKLIRG